MLELVELQELAVVLVVVLAVGVPLELVVVLVVDVVGLVVVVLLVVEVGIDVGTILVVGQVNELCVSGVDSPFVKI